MSNGTTPQSRTFLVKVSLDANFNQAVQLQSDQMLAVGYKLAAAFPIGTDVILIYQNVG